MASPILAPEKNAKKKFVPKRRAPYLLQDEIIRQKILDEKTASCSDQNEISITEESTHKVQEEKQKKVVNKKSNSSQLVVSLNYHEEVSKLYGIQKRIAHYFVNCCIARRDVTTGPVTAEVLCSVANTTKKTLKKILQRMIEKNLITRVDGKRGKGGFSVFCLDKEFIDVMRLQSDLENHHLSMVNQQYSAHQKTKKYISESILPQEWQDIDFTAIKEIGFGLPQLRQLYNKNITNPETVQDSINHFAFVLENKPEKLKKYDDKLATFMSVLHKGGAWVDKDYRLPQEIAQRELIERKKAERERLKQLEEEAYKIALEEWQDTLSKDQIESIAPSKKSKNGFIIPPQSVRLSLYFKEKVWPEKKADYIVLNNVH